MSGGMGELIGRIPIFDELTKSTINEKKI